MPSEDKQIEVTKQIVELLEIMQKKISLLENRIVWLEGQAEQFKQDISELEDEVGL